MTNLHPRYIASHVIGYKPLANTIEVFLDYNCPFSGKMFKKIDTEILPLLKEKGLNDKYNIVFVNVIQPWHGFQSSILHDISFAVSKIAPNKFWDISRIFFNNIELFYDTQVINKSRKTLTEEILNLIKNDLSIEDLNKIKELLIIDGENSEKISNMGNSVIKDNKYFTRYHRTLGIHMTPSVMINGILISQIESSTDASKIIEIFESQCN